jgi:virginiamycin B lyase
MTAFIPRSVGRGKLALVLLSLLCAGLLAGVGGYLLFPRSPEVRFVEYRMPELHDAPIAIAAAADGTIWFTIDRADAIGRIRAGRLERLPTSGPNIEPTGLGIGQDGSAWFTDMAARAIARIGPTGEVSRFTLDTPIVRLGRLVVAPEGAAWFAESTRSSITRLKDGSFTRYQVEPSRGGPYGVAMAPDGSVWATLQSGNQLLRINAAGRVENLEIPRPGALPTDVAAGSDGSVWFLQFRANRIGRWRSGTFDDFEIGGESAGLSGLAVAPDKSVWFGMLRRSSLGRLRDGKIKAFKLPRDNARPYTLVIDPVGNVWYADITGYIGMLPADQISD